MHRPRILTLRLSLALLAGVGLALAATGPDLRAEEEGAPAPGAAAPAAPLPPFATPEAASAALVEAFAANDDARLAAVLGAGSEEFIEDGRDPVVRARRLELAEQAASGLALTPVEEGVEGRPLLLEFGADRWPFPVPLVRGEAGWTFDVAAGRDEILARQIGRHELDAIAFCRVYAHLQEQYFSEDRDADGVREYAQYLFSRPGTKSGLWWESAQGEPESPLTAALAPLTGPDGPDLDAPFAGYYWRSLRAQGAKAPGGAYDYVVNGNMVAGYALIAWPAVYRKTGVMTFLISRNGVLYQKDLGEETERHGTTVERFEPDDTWSEVQAGDEVLLPDGEEKPLVPTGPAAR